MTTLLLVRHGHTDAAGKRLTGRAPGVHLNELGRRQAERLVERLDGLRIEGVRAYGRMWTVAVERGHVTIAEGV